MNHAGAGVSHLFKRHVIERRQTASLPLGRQSSCRR